MGARGRERVSRDAPSGCDPAGFRRPLRPPARRETLRRRAPDSSPPRAPRAPRAGELAWGGDAATQEIPTASDPRQEGRPLHLPRAPRGGARIAATPTPSATTPAPAGSTAARSSGLLPALRARGRLGGDAATQDTPASYSAPRGPPPPLPPPRSAGEEPGSLLPLLPQPQLQHQQVPQPARSSRLLPRAPRAGEAGRGRCHPGRSPPRAIRAKRGPPPPDLPRASAGEEPGLLLPLLPQPQLQHQQVPQPLVSLPTPPPLRAGEAGRGRRHPEIPPARDPPQEGTPPPDLPRAARGRSPDRLRPLLPQPQLEHQQVPQPLAVVDPPVLLVEQPPHRCAIEIEWLRAPAPSSRSRAIGRSSPRNQPSTGSAKPRFLRVRIASAQPRRHPPQDPFPRSPLNLRRPSRPAIHSIEPDPERRPHLEGVGHGGDVDLHQDVVGQVGLGVQVEEAVDVVGGVAGGEDRSEPAPRRHRPPRSVGPAPGRPCRAGRSGATSGR